MVQRGIQKRPIIKNGKIDFKELAYAQMQNNQRGTDVYTRYETFWKESIEKNRELVTRRAVIGAGVNEVYGDVVLDNLTTRGVNANQDHTCGDDEVWVGIKFTEEETHYKLQDLRGDSIKAEDLETIKDDSSMYTEFELRCWAEFIGKDIQNNEELYDEIANLLELPINKVLGARVDSDYDEDKGDVIISFKARITRSVG